MFCASLTTPPSSQVLALFELSKIVTSCFGACMVILIDEIDGLCNESPEPASSRLVYQFQTSFSGSVCPFRFLFMQCNGPGVVLDVEHFCEVVVFTACLRVCAMRTCAHSGVWVRCDAAVVLRIRFCSDVNRDHPCTVLPFVLFARSGVCTKCVCTLGARSLSLCASDTSAGFPACRSMSGVTKPSSLEPRYALFSHCACMLIPSDWACVCTIIFIAQPCFRCEALLFTCFPVSSWSIACAVSFGHLVCCTMFLRAQNKPYNISVPIRDRFDAKIFVPLPDEMERSAPCACLESVSRAFVCALPGLSTSMCR